jgi:hypothetical protein
VTYWDVQETACSACVLHTPKPELAGTKPANLFLPCLQASARLWNSDRSSTNILEFSRHTAVETAMSSMVCASYRLQTCKVSTQQRAAHSLSLRVFPSRPHVDFPRLPLTTLRTAVRRRGKAAISAAGPSHPDWDALFSSASLSDEPHATILTETTSADSSASCKPYVARKQLNQLFQTLSAEKHITAMQNFKCCQSCGHRAIDEHASVDDIGYCFFHVSIVMPSNHGFRVLLTAVVNASKRSSKHFQAPRRPSMQQCKVSECIR